MYEIVKNVIMYGSFKLDDMTKKINTLWVQGDITEEQKTELIALMKEYLNPETETPEALKLCQELRTEINSIKERVAKLENGGVAPEPPVGVIVPVWEPWDGISDRYKYGSVVTVDQKYYISIFQGQNTWMPGSVGTEGLWKEISKGDAEAVVSGTKTPEQVINGQ